VGNRVGSAQERANLMGKRWDVIHGDCLEAMKGLPDNSVDAVVTDPPYGLSFMGKNWDHGVPGEAFWAEAMRVAKPGAHMLGFGGSRTFHRLWCAVEDAGWEIRDTLFWAYGSGFPKSMDVSKAIDKAAGVEREGGEGECRVTAPATPAARQWQGWGTALKPAFEPIVMARKPLEGTVAANVLKWGTGAINVDACRVGNTLLSEQKAGKARLGTFDRTNMITPKRVGRWPANLIHDGSPEVLDLFPETGPSKSNPRRNGEFKSVAKGRDLPHVTFGHDDLGGSASRFFKSCPDDDGEDAEARRLIYCAKASKRDRDEGCDGLDERLAGCLNMRNDAHAQANGMTFSPKRNVHPTVKATALMRYLVRLVTPPGGLVLDPFTGSGSTGKAAMAECFRFLGIEKESEYVEIARARIQHAAGGNA
jgi:DNA modification methylase